MDARIAELKRKQQYASLLMTYCCTIACELPETAVAQLKSQIPLQRLGKVQDVAAVVSFLLSPDASYLTGQVVNCDGGMVMG